MVGFMGGSGFFISGRRTTAGLHDRRSNFFSRPAASGSVARLATAFA
jgi:hypothetical protein